MEITLISPLILAFVEMLKRAGMPDRFAPVASVAIGLALAFAFNQEPLYGAIAGFTAIGLWSGGKNTLEAIR